MIRVIYAFFLGLLLVLFVGMGIQAFYPAPQYPKAPENSLERPVPGVDKPITDDETAEEKSAREAYDRQLQDYQEKNNRYNRDVSIVALGAALFLLVTSLLLIHSIDVIADGLLLGGIFNLLYSIGRGFVADDQKYQFFIISFGLIIALILGYYKFILPLQPAKAEKPDKKDEKK